MNKMGLGLVLVVVSLVSVSVAKADFIAGRVRTTQVANKLDKVNVDGQVVQTNAADFSAQQQDGKKDFVSFNLDQNVVVMCFRAPCPVLHTTKKFRVVSVQHLDHQITEYQAIELPSNPAAGEFVGTHLQVTEDDYTHDISITQTSPLNQNIRNMYEGTFEDLAVTL